MNATEIARLVGAKKIFSKGGVPVYRGKCPVHGGNSLEVTDGRKGVLMKCMGGCDTKDVLAALGLKWRDLGDGRDQPISPAAREAYRDRLRMDELKRKHGLAIMAQAVLPAERKYWAAAEANLAKRIEELTDKMNPGRKETRERREKLERYINRHGWDKLWDYYLATSDGQDTAYEWGQ